jgi:hypothetical protein
MPDNNLASVVKKFIQGRKDKVSLAGATLDNNKSDK